MDILFIILFAFIVFLVSDALPIIDMHGIKGYIERLKGNPDWRKY
jgi:hypothetical protein